MMAHTGQYNCQRCKEAFKSTKILDDHIKSKHTEPKKSVEHRCDKCDATFTAIHHLRIHSAKQHAHVNTSKQAEVNCEMCGFIITSMEQMVKHKELCRGGFQEVRNKVCKYFVSASGCWKGQQCRFSHPQTKQFQDTPACKNGNFCTFLAKGVCSFFHRGVGVQKPRIQLPVNQTNQNPTLFQQETRGWCKYLEDCNKVPNCPFIHAKEDFPELSQTNHPHQGRRMNQRQ